MKYFSAISHRMSAEGFEAQLGTNQLFLVRPSIKRGLFERIEMASVGVRNDVLVLSIAISVVRLVVLQLRGLFRRAGVPGLCTDPANGRVSFSATPFQEWIEQLAERAPLDLNHLASTRGEDLLGSTVRERQRALQLHHDLLVRYRPSALYGMLTSEQEEAVQRLLSIPQMVPSAEFKEQCKIAVTAMVLAKDPDVVEITRRGIVAPSGDYIFERAVLPMSLLMKTRILVDMMSRDTVDSGRTG